jgi:dihydroorotate dehydrogenase (NAD+) catalytic subunit
MGITAIDLAPGHKLGLVVPSPVLLAAGTIGSGEALSPGLDPAKLGGVVVGPLQRHPQAGTAPPRLAEAAAAFVLESGLQNRGVAATLKRSARLWPRLGCPVIVQLADTEVHFLGVVAERLATATMISGFELLVPQSASADRPTERWLERALRSIIDSTDLPVWVKLPLNQAAKLAPVAVAAGAAALVIGQPAIGTLPYQGLASGPGAAGAGQLVRGALYGPALFPLMLTALIDVAQLGLPTALIACGGIHTVAQARQTLAAGATALQIDSAVWIEPGLPAQITQALWGSKEG